VDRLNREFAAGNFENAALSRAHPYDDALLETRFHGLELRDGRTLPLWDGEPIDNLAVLFCDGFGDALLFGRYLAPLRSHAKRVIAVVDAPLRTLFEQNAPATADVFDFTDCAEGLKLADCARVSAFPAQRYRHRPWRGRMDHERTALRGARTASARPHRAMLDRLNRKLEQSTAFDSPNRFARLLEMPGIEWHSLQADKRAVPPAGVIDHAHELRSFLDTVNLIATLDLVISVDTAVANLVGSIGVPLWALAERPGESDFRWPLSGEATPWVPCSARVPAGR
jgi:hypothetical protein